MLEAIEEEMTALKGENYPIKNINNGKTANYIDDYGL
jgi:hypothetical protein